MAGETSETPTANQMPRLGIGTWQNTDPEACATAVRTALDMGYRHVDTAQAYGNEADVGRGLEQAAVDREDIFLATKVWIDNMEPSSVRETTRSSLDRLGTEYLDLLYVHWPARTYDPERTLPALEDLLEEGLVDRIGVSNFEPEQIDRARSILKKPIFANQVEMHPLLPQKDLREYLAGTDIELVAYSPLARGEVFDVPEITQIAEKHGGSEAQVSLAWLREKGVTTIPKATSEAHIRDNWASRGLDLDDKDMTKIDGIKRKDRRVDPSFAPW